MFKSYIQSINSNISKREKAIGRLLKEVERLKEMNKKRALRVKELEKLQAEKAKGVKKVKAKAKTAKAKPAKKPKVVFRIASGA